MRNLVLLFLLIFTAVSSATETINLTSKNTVLLRGAIAGESVAKAQLKIAALNKTRLNGQKIYLVLDSPGGEIDAGESLISYLKTIKDLDTVTIFAASMASAIVEALPGRRYTVEHGKFMFHRAQVGLQGYVETGEVESQLALVKADVLRMELRNSARIGISLADYKSKVVGEWWMNSYMAIKANVADEIVSLQCSQELIDGRTEVALETFFGVIKSTYSNCPAFEFPVNVQLAQ